MVQDRRAGVKEPAADGFVEIPPEVVDRVEGDACKVTITPEDERPGEPGAHSARGVRRARPRLRPA